jgi:hypothetical protein
VNCGEDVLAAPSRSTAPSKRVDLDDAGHFVVCGVARERPIHLRYMEGERFADTTVITADTLMHPVEWRPMVSPPKRNPLEIPASNRMIRSGRL